MTVDEVMAELAARGSAQTKKTFLRHGAREPFFGVKVADLKGIQKRVRRDHELALGLYATGNSDAMYLAALIAEPHRMTKADLRRWAKAASWHMIAEYAVAWTAAASRFGPELAVEWMASPKELVASAGWATYSSVVSVTPDEGLNMDEVEGLLRRIPGEIGTAPNRVRYAMNGFVIAVGSSVTPLTAAARATAQSVGTVDVDVGDTSCQIPDAAAYINKVAAAGRLGRKRKAAAC